MCAHRSTDVGLLFPGNRLFPDGLWSSRGSGSRANSWASSRRWC